MRRSQSKRKEGDPDGGGAREHAASSHALVEVIDSTKRTHARHRDASPTSCMRVSGRDESCESRASPSGVPMKDGEDGLRVEV